MKWKHTAGDPISAALSYTSPGEDHYVVSHRKRQHTVSFRPPGKHEHVATCTSARKARNAAESHAAARRVEVAS